MEDYQLECDINQVGKEFVRASDFITENRPANYPGGFSKNRAGKYTFNLDRRKLNVPELIKRGAIFVTYPHGDNGWETDAKLDWQRSILTLYNVLFDGGWTSEAKKYLKPQSYKKAEQDINSSAPNLGSDESVYDGKYNQILWSIKKLGIPDSVAFLDKDKQGVAEVMVFEEQKFDFEKDKNSILSFVKQVLSGSTPQRNHNIFYGIIVGNPVVGAAANIGITPEILTAWKKYFQSPPFIGGSPEPWSQFNLGDQFKKATGDDRTLNYYITIAKDKNNIFTFFKNYHKLASYLKPISQQYQTPIKFKTHSLLDSFIGHNDSFKVYYYDPKVKELVINATKKFLQDNNIKTSSRSHEHGVDVKSGGGSFGQILSNHVYDTFTKLIQTHKDKYTPEQYYEWLKKNLPSLIQNVKQKEQGVAEGKSL